VGTHVHTCKESERGSGRRWRASLLMQHSILQVRLLAMLITNYI
jgi:hypothetical protein